MNFPFTVYCLYSIYLWLHSPFETQFVTCFKILFPSDPQFQRDNTVATRNWNTCSRTLTVAIWYINFAWRNLVGVVVRRTWDPVVKLIIIKDVYNVYINKITAQFSNINLIQFVNWNRCNKSCVSVICIRCIIFIHIWELKLIWLFWLVCKYWCNMVLQFKWQMKFKLHIGKLHIRIQNWNSNNLISS